VQVGLEPVAVAVRNDEEVWVTNLLSDSVSVVDVSNPRHGLVARTLLVGDSRETSSLPVKGAIERLSPRRIATK